MFWYPGFNSLESNNSYIKLLKSYGCKANFYNMSNDELKDHLSVHEFCPDEVEE